MLFLGLLQLLFSRPIQNHKIEPSALAELLSAFDINESDDIVAATQEKWLRDANQERWETDSLSDEKNKLVLDWIHKNNFFRQWGPNRNQYDFALILGATTESMQKRLDFLVKLYNSGTRFNKVIWLTGERPLNMQVDNVEFGKTESDAAKFIWENSNIPKKMKNILAQFIRVKMKLKNGCLARPNTQDTIVDWLKGAPNSCTALFVSNQHTAAISFL